MTNVSVDLSQVLESQHCFILFRMVRHKDGWWWANISSCLKPRWECTGLTAKRQRTQMKTSLTTSPSIFLAPNFTERSNFYETTRMCVSQHSIHPWIIEHYVCTLEFCERLHKIFETIQTLSPLSLCCIGSVRTQALIAQKGYTFDLRIECNHWNSRLYYGVRQNISFKTGSNVLLHQNQYVKDVCKIPSRTRSPWLVALRTHVLPSAPRGEVVEPKASMYILSRLELLALMLCRFLSGSHSTAWRLEPLRLPWLYLGVDTVLTEKLPSDVEVD